MKCSATVVGGGLAGCELALQLAARGTDVSLVEMRPGTPTEAHRTGMLAELVCSNSLKSDDPLTASGLLKREIRMLGCRLLAAAQRSRVEAGHALAVDRELFSAEVTRLIEGERSITLERREQHELPGVPFAAIATGPLTSAALACALEAQLAAGLLYFYDAISISVSADSIDPTSAYRASRYGKGGDDYWNVPLDRDEYARLVRALRDYPVTERHQFEKMRCFESCLPVEVLAARGEDTLRFGPLKPKGLPDPRTGREPHAVIQLRRETRDGTMYGLVGFQTRLTRSAQRELLTGIAGFREPEILRFGSIHRNTFVDSPRLLDAAQMSHVRPGLFFAGQISGVEGYVESIMHGLITAINITRYCSGSPPAIFPVETMIGALQRHLATGKAPFQPMNANFGMLPAIGGARKDRKQLYGERSLESLAAFIRTEGDAFIA